MSGQVEKSFSRHARIRARRSAVQALYQWHMTKEPMSLIVKEFEVDRAAELKKADKSYFKEILAETTRHAADIEASLVPYLDRKLQEIDPVERAILCLGIYELKFRPELPWRVVLNESIELARMFGAEASHKYVNGVLDRAARQIRDVETARAG